jgi:SpoVK/Ycf46/Vps4 family AAA+-type ATPase
VSKAIVENKTTWPNTPLKDFIAIISANKTAVVQKSDVLELLPPANMDDVGGLEVLKEWITMRKRCFTQEARDFGVDVPKGAVFIGPPGTGKSLAAKAIAYELEQPLIKFDIGKVFNSLVGESEARVRSALKQLEAIAPCVVLLDEVDKGLGGSHNGGGDSGVSQRILGTILTFMQENRAPIFWIMTANRVNGLPPELLRKGRMDEVFSVLPPNALERVAVLKIHLRKRFQNPDEITDLEVAVSASEGFVSAELEAAVKEAVTVAFHTDVKVTGELIKEQLGLMKPISVAFKEDFDRMRQWAAENARPASRELVAPARARIPMPAPDMSGSGGRAINVGH